MNGYTVQYVCVDGAGFVTADGKPYPMGPPQSFARFEDARSYADRQQQLSDGHTGNPWGYYYIVRHHRSGRETYRTKGGAA